MSVIDKIIYRSAYKCNCELNMTTTSLSIICYPEYNRTTGAMPCSLQCVLKIDSIFFICSTLLMKVMLSVNVINF